MKIYELVEEYRWLQDQLESSEDEDMKEVIRDTLDSMEVSFEDKFEQLVRMIKNFQGTIDAIKEEKRALTQKQNVLENRVESIKMFMEDTLRSIGERNIQAGIWKVAIQKNPPSLDWDVAKDWQKVPEDFRTPQPDKVDSRALLAFIKGQENQEFNGIKIKQGESIRIR